MAKEDSAKALRETIGQALSFREKHLESRQEWGAITFEAAALSFKRIFELLAHLSVLPLEYATDQAISQIDSEVKAVISLFDNIDKFSIEQQNPTQVRSGLVDQVRSRAENLYAAASPWVPFLAYQKGDVAKNIEALTLAVSQATGMVETAKETITNRQHEIEGIITQAREASAAAGAAVFTQDFKREAAELASNGGNWLVATGVLGAVTLLFAILIWLVQVGPSVRPISLIAKNGTSAIISITTRASNSYIPSSVIPCSTPAQPVL